VNKTIIAYHFVGETLRDGQPVPADGVWLEHKGRIEICKSGLHASLSPFDALKYAPGPTLCLVECKDEIIHGDNKLVCSRRRIIKRFDATGLLRLFARQQALSVIHRWRAPKVVREYLETGDESKRSAAWSAAKSAAKSAAWSVAKSAAWSAAESAAWSAAKSAAASAAKSVAKSAAWSAAESAAWSAAWSVAGTAAKESFCNAVNKEFSKLP
jgi:hypothetical protein